MPISDTAFREFQEKVFTQLATLNANTTANALLLNEQMQTLTESVQQRFHHIETKLEKTTYLLMGNGSPGVLGRLDRLEQKDKNRTWLSRATVIAAIGAIVSAVAHFIKGNH